MPTDRPAPGSDPSLLVLSNRLPITLQRTGSELEVRRSSGGLVSALEPALQRRGGTWVGWPGAKLRPGETLADLGAGFEIEPVQLNDREVQRYYHGFSNSTLWPLLHSLPDRAHFDEASWRTYDRVNQRFAEAAARHAADADVIWIHDYQLLRAPLHLRRILPDARIAFFLHIPFPPWDIFRLLPWEHELLQGMLAADLIGFHVSGYVSNFVDCVRRGLSARVDVDTGLIEQGERTARVGAFPLGIDFELYERRAREAPPSEAALLPPGGKLILGVDRLDYTKGIPQRVRAFERLLELHPEHREKVVLLQVAVPSRSHVGEYRELKREIDELVGRVNGRFATPGWSPIQYLYRSIGPEQLAMLYRDAHVALVTPLRDGMNLVAKEYVASQVGDPGVLVLSRLAGAAATMREAVRVNPFHIEGTANAIHRALEMSEEERRSRMVGLRKRERRDHVGAWLSNFLEAATAPVAVATTAGSSDYEALIDDLFGRYHLALFLDYDGTLAPIATHPGEAHMSPGMRAMLETCARRADTDVTIVSGRGLDDVSKMVGLPELTYAGNHGLEIAGPDLRDFEHDDLSHYRNRLDELATVLDDVCVPGAWVEAKGASLTLHFREVEPAQHEALVGRARPLIRAAGFQAHDALCALEARPPIGWDKGHAVLHVLRERYGPSWSERVRAIYVGDDRTDEDAFRVLSGLGVTFRVGDADVETLANRRLSSVTAVERLLRFLCDRPSHRVA